MFIVDSTAPTLLGYEIFSLTLNNFYRNNFPLKWFNLNYLNIFTLNRTVHSHTKKLVFSHYQVRAYKGILTTKYLFFYLFVHTLNQQTRPRPQLKKGNKFCVIKSLTFLNFVVVGRVRTVRQNVVVFKDDKLG